MNIPVVIWIDICIYKYYLVNAKFAHVGQKYCIRKEVPVKAKNKKEAAKIVKNMPRVKKNIKNSILNVEEITHEEYMKALKKYKEDKYFECHNIQDQNRLCPYWKLERQLC